MLGTSASSFHEPLAGTATRQTTWFLACSASKCGKVQTSFGKIADAFDDEALPCHRDGRGSNGLSSAMNWRFRRSDQPNVIVPRQAFGGRVPVAHAPRNADSRDYFGQNTSALN